MRAPDERHRIVPKSGADDLEGPAAGRRLGVIERNKLDPAVCGIEVRGTTGKSRRERYPFGLAVVVDDGGLKHFSLASNTERATPGRRRYTLSDVER